MAKRVRKNILIIFAAIVLIAAFASGTFVAIWKNEIATIASICEISQRNDAHQDGSVYVIKYKGDYYFDEFLESGGAEDDKELIGFITEKITKGIIPMKIEESDIACSSFTAEKENGDKLFARNYDFKKTNTAIVFTEKSEGRYASVSTVDLQFLGIDNDKGIESWYDKISSLAAVYAPLDGMNEKGVCCGIYMTYQGDGKTVATDQRTEKPDITSTTMLRLILDYAGSVDEAVELVKKYDLHDSANTSYHYMVADKTGKSAVLEWVGETDKTDNDGKKRELIVRFNDEKYQCVTNFVLKDGYYSGEKSRMKGLDRYEKISKELGSINGVVKDEAEAMDILLSVGRRKWDNDDMNSITVHSVVYNMTNGNVYWVANENHNDAGTFKFNISD